MLLEVLNRRTRKLRNVRPGAGREIDTARLLGKTEQELGVHLTDNMLTGSITPQTPIRRGIRDRRTARGSHPDGNNMHALLASLIRSGCFGANRIFSVAENNKGITAPGGTAAEGIERAFEQQPEVCATVACPACIHPLQHIAQGPVVIGERHHHIRIPRKDDQAYLIPRQRIQELQGRRACLLQAAGCHVIREHGTRDIQGDEQIATGSARGGLRKTGHGAGQRDDTEHQSPQDRHCRQNPPPRRAGGHQLRVLRRHERTPGIPAPHMQHCGCCSQQERHEQKQ